MLAANVPFLDQLVFKKVKQELGGKLNFVASGAAPLSKNNQMFLRAYADTPLAPFSAFSAPSSGRRRSRASRGPFRCFGVQVVQGYGTLAVTDLCSCGTPLTVSLLVWCPALTETAGAGTLQAYDDPTFSNVGRPNMCCGAFSCLARALAFFPCVATGGLTRACCPTFAEIKLVDAPKMGYTTDDEEGPAGEILIRGPNVSRGYLKLDDKTYAPASQNGCCSARRARACSRQRAFSFVHGQ